jgi:MSHA biogenesis protein MshJ
MTRERALRERLATLDSQLAEASQGYVSPERMALLLRALFAGQRGLRLVSLRNLPVENLSPPEAADRAGRPADAAAASGQGPYLHPVEIVLEGDYASVVGYLRDLERLPWRLHWRKLDISTLQYPNNRVRIEIGTLSLSRDWMAV